jgi:uncharacterized membrane protein
MFDRAAHHGADIALRAAISARGFAATTVSYCLRRPASFMFGVNLTAGFVMEELIRIACAYIALSIEAVAALVIAYGTVEALVGLSTELFKWTTPKRRRDVWSRFGVWLLLGLEFELAADIIRSAISPSWTDIGQLAAIAAIRTFLNYFLESDIERLSKPDVDQPAAS